MKINKKLLSALMPLIYTSVLFLVCSFICISSVFGWFATNKEVSSDGVQVETRGDYNVDVVATETSFSDLIPGEKTSVEITITNNETFNVESTIKISASNTDLASVYYIESVSGAITYTGDASTTISDGLTLSQKVRVESNRTAKIIVVFVFNESNDNQNELSNSELLVTITAILDLAN